MNRIIRNISVFCLLSFILCLTGCRPKGILHSWEMRDVLIDLHKTDALLQVCGYQYGFNEASNIYYAEVLERHGVTQAQFDSSLVWYTAHPQLFDKIYPRVIARLDAELAALPEEFTPRQEVLVQRPPLTEIQLDSMLWVSQHGLPHMWHPAPYALSPLVR